MVDRRGITIYTRRPAFDRRIRDPLRSWWRELRIDLFWIANIILALAVGCFVAAILTSRFTQPLKYLWGGIIAVIIAVLLHYAGASMQARAEEEQRIREEEAFRRQLARETTPIEE